MKELVDFVVLIIIYFWKFYKKWKEKGRDVLVVNTTMYIYLSFVLYFTLMPVITSLPFIFNHSYTPMNLVPFIVVLNSIHPTNTETQELARSLSENYGVPVMPISVEAMNEKDIMEILKTAMEKAVVATKKNFSGEMLDLLALRAKVAAVGAKV